MAQPAGGKFPATVRAPDGAANQPAASSDAAQIPAPGQKHLANLALTSRALVYTAQLTVRVTDVLSATATAEQVAAASGGFVGDEKSQSDPNGTGGVTESVVTLRVPATAFDDDLGKLGTGGKIVQQSRSASDVTGQVADVTSRVASEQASIARISDLMKSAGSLSDVVALEGDLATRESDLESLQAQQAALKDQVSLATITVTYLGPTATTGTAPPPPRRNPFMRGLTSAGHAFADVAKVLLIAVGGLLPVGILAALCWWPAHRLLKLKKRPPALTAGPTAGPTGPATAPDTVTAR